MEALWDIIVNLIYPKRCSFCKVLINDNSKYSLCETCFDRIKFISNNCCEKCGKQLSGAKNSICFDCRSIEHYFDKAYSVAEYVGILKYGLIRYKFFGFKSAKNTFAEMLIEKAMYIEKFDLLVPVPISKERMLQRSYNQCEILVRQISKRLKLEADTKNLVKIKSTAKQSSLTKQERLKNLKDCFAVNNNNRILGRNILLVDDIYTTGATASECARTLKENGANKVYVLTVASGKGY